MTACPPLTSGCRLLAKVEPRAPVFRLPSSGLPAWPSNPAQVTVDEKDIVLDPEQLTVRITIPK